MRDRRWIVELTGLLCIIGLIIYSIRITKEYIALRFIDSRIKAYALKTKYDPKTEEEKITRAAEYFNASKDCLIVVRSYERGALGNEMGCIFVNGNIRFFPIWDWQYYQAAAHMSKIQKMYCEENIYDFLDFFIEHYTVPKGWKEYKRKARQAYNELKASKREKTKGQ